MKKFIKGTYITNIYSNSSNGYLVGLIKIKEVSDDDELKQYLKKTINFNGNFIDLKIGCDYTFYGELVNHPKFGMQYLVNEYEIALPTKKEEMISFLSSKLFPIGEKTATRIFNKLGEEAIKKILEDYTILYDIPRIDMEKAVKIQNALKNYEKSNSILIRLTKLGFTLKEALGIYYKYREDTENIVNNDIFKLIEDLELPFVTVDNAARELGVLENDEGRMKALIIHIIKDYTFSTGDTYMVIDDIVMCLNKFRHDITLDEIRFLLIKLNQNGKVIIENDKYYLKEFYKAEKLIVNKLCFLNDMKKDNIKNLDKFIKKLEGENSIVYDDKQKEAIKKALINNICIITGGPGTGKTTIIKAIVQGLKDVLKVNENDIALLAPTGRAAKRMCESVGLPAYTIHRFLKWDKESNSFSVNSYNPAKEKYIILDEVSMIDTLVMASLLDGVRRDIKLIMVGDYNQLPSVSQGQLLKDIIDSNVIEVIKLNSLYRQNENSYIINLAKEIREKNLSKSFYEKKDDYNFIKCSNTVVKTIVEQIIDKVIGKNISDKNVQFLVPMYKGENGIDNLNKLIQEKLNPYDKSKSELKVGDVIYRQNDKILHLVNDVENNVFNGDIGYIKKINRKDLGQSKRNEIIIDYDGHVVTYTNENFNDFRHGYVISVHKAQGSEFDIVVMPIVNSYKRMLYNKLVYTGITRAKKTLILVGDIEAFMYGVMNDNVDNRKTTLKDFLMGKYNNI